MCLPLIFTLCLRGLVLVTLFLLATAHRSFRIDNSLHYAQQQDKTLTRALEVSTLARETFLPGGVGKPLLARRVQEAGTSSSAQRPIGSRRSLVAMQSKELKRALELEDVTASARQPPAMRTATPFAMRDAHSRRAAGVIMAENRPKFSVPESPLRSAFLALIAAQTAYALVTQDVPSLNSAEPDFLSTAFDVGFLFYSINVLAKQAGVKATLDNASPQPSLVGLDCSVTMSVGREPGTWMPKEWGASGARLSLPLAVRFSDEPVDLGYPGEETMGGRNARRLDCEGGSFVGLAGEVVVAAKGGAWNVLPSGRPGESLVRFFIDFPEGATRNDVSLPAGRVFFNCASWDSEKQREEMGAEEVEVVEAPSGAQLLARGELFVKERNGLRNLGGALGDVMLRFGTFTAKGNKPTNAAEPSVPQPAAPP